MRKFLLAALVAVWTMVNPAAAEETPPDTAPDTAKVGLYLLSLHALNIGDQTFGADFWIWESHTNPRLQPLKSMELTNAKSASASLQDGEEENGTFWNDQKVQGTFRHDWDMRNFPFDRHVLSVVLEESKDEAGKLKLVPDTQSSGVAKDLKVDGFTIRSVSVQGGQRDYDTNFGQPTAEASTAYSQVRMDIELQRNSLVLFLKLHTALYAAFLVSATCFAMLPFIPSMMNTVNSVIVGTLFASIINLRAADPVIGRGEAVTLVDRLHFVTFVHLVALGMIAMWIMLTRKKWDDAVLTRFSRRAGFVYVGSYVLCNALLIWNAAS